MYIAFGIHAVFLAMKRTPSGSNRSWADAQLVNIIKFPRLLNNMICGIVIVCYHLYMNRLNPILKSFVMENTEAEECIHA